MPVYSPISFPSIPELLRSLIRSRSVNRPRHHTSDRPNRPKSEEYIVNRVFFDHDPTHDESFIIVYEQVTGEQGRQTKYARVRPEQITFTNEKTCAELIRFEYQWVIDQNPQIIKKHAKDKSYESLGEWKRLVAGVTLHRSNSVL